MFPPERVGGGGRVGETRGKAVAESGPSAQDTRMESVNNKTNVVLGERETREMHGNYNMLKRDKRRGRGFRKMC